jgi:hypothetical protein
VRVEERDIVAPEHPLDHRLQFGAFLDVGIDHDAGCIICPDRQQSRALLCRHVIDEACGLADSLAHVDRPAGAIR